MLNQNLNIILQQLEAEKSVDRNTLIEAIRSAIESAAHKSMNRAANVTVEVEMESLEFKVFEIRTVTETVEDPVSEISLEAALVLNPDVVVGNRLKVPSEPKDFGRIAAQTAKQVIIQKIKDAERDKIFTEFKEREGELITGVVKRIGHGNIVVSVGRAEAIVPHREQSPRENYRPGDRIRAYLIEVEKSSRGTQIILSRATPELVRGLFELEVPEIYDGTVEIKAIAREAGSRTKVAVASNDANVDEVGACVGMKGSRVRTVVEELSGEKLDIVRWSENPLELCANALNPADIVGIQVDEENGVIKVTVPQDQLSLAIGKRGQNARLASRLIGWSIDIEGDGESESTDDPAGSAPEHAEGGVQEIEASPNTEADMSAEESSPTSDPETALSEDASEEEEKTGDAESGE
jgi:transcription termination/antitermination protein NusA